jgi:ABC-type transporter Mla subunit MlaD
MTIDERFARIEHVTAGLAEERRKDREELRGLWRDTQRQLDQLTGRVDAIATHLDTFIAESAARDRVTDQRFRDTDARIDKMISSMGEFIRALPVQGLPPA